MFEKLLLAATITFSLNLFIGLSTQSGRPSTITAQSTQPPVSHSIYIARVLHDRLFLHDLFQ